jgi:hypothetical protein
MGMTLIELYIFILYALQILLGVNMIISLYYRIFRNTDVSVINKLALRKSVINYYFMILVSLLMVYLLNPFSGFVVEVTGELKSILFSSAVIQLIFLFQKEGNSI